MDYKTIIIDKNGYTLEVWDTMNWGAEYIRKIFDKETAEKIITYWGK